MTAGVSGEVVLTEVADTEDFGRSLATTLRAGDLVILDGPLGAGKTALSRGIGAGLGVVGRVTSPTFVIARAHRASEPGRPGMVHVDAYRLGGSEPGSDTGVDLLDELDALDLDTDLRDSVVVVEWGAGVAERLAARHLLVRLSREPESEVRHARWRWVDA
ncbi:tRNA (adenosine(37)-N6)-threonylcarbamoyltransferase complex ATPase subunit type 1 TsaE [Gordonia sp. X0973]|uniref:tRNA (adenosine(37)-N6)-threonylcarbamoyltransferase complex ATPase subunit type 1 TsaE n=1 Tax=Gordonia sp. X0973 TaxID=2742602 RepID=UPI000F53C64A|nr:tRNA (adenosine(37)-N6)-threonylcarbamoyltransferase complex ATPase subunit type 1 TsaE [Gordonia sp. X0973]QKT06669.1 tRNA (adenosine(37)-N6)-threonylcarbamoyltransferase complex ATPase subunit type 1 TsaE [Gordonia sp. X0973]